MPTFACQLHAVSLRHHSRTRLHETSLDIEEGTITAVVGANGSGKSTLMGVMSGELSPDTGSVHLRGHDLKHMNTKEKARLRSVLDQHTPMTFSFTVKDVVGWGRYCWQSSPQSAHDDDVIDAALERLNLTDLANRSIREISAGEMSRVHLARILAQEAPIVMLDEADADLDLSARIQLDNVIRALREQGSTVIMVTHDVSRVNALADHVIGIKEGRVVHQHDQLNPQAVAELFSIPIDEATRALHH